MVKRFRLGNVLTKCSGIRDNGELLTFNEVVELLNELYEENEQLKQQFNRIRVENQQLRTKLYEKEFER